MENSNKEFVYSLRARIIGIVFLAHVCGGVEGTLGCYPVHDWGWWMMAVAWVVTCGVLVVLLRMDLRDIRKLEKELHKEPKNMPKVFINDPSGKWRILLSSYGVKYKEEGVEEEQAPTVKKVKVSSVTVYKKVEGASSE